jgi:acyl carrier protein
MNVSEIRERIKATIVRSLELPMAPEEIQDEAILFGPAMVGGLELDSLAAIEIVVGMSNEFNLSLENVPREAFQSVATLGEFIAGRLAQQRAASG